MARQKSSIQITIETATKGAAEIDALIKQLEEMGVEVESVSTEFNQLEKELSDLGRQQQTIQRLEQTNKVFDETAKALDKATKEAKELERQLEQTAKPSKRLTAEFERQQAKVQKLEGAYRKEADALKRAENAAKAAGVDTQRLTASKVKLAARSKEAAAATDRMAGSLRRSRNELKQTAATAETSATGFNKLKGALTGAAAAFAGRFFVKANADMEGLAKGFELVTGSAEDAAREMSFVRNEAQRLGISTEAASKAYLSLSAAARGTALEGRATREIFSSIATAMGRLGKSAADTEGALQAVQQMISKGKVSAEELRGQLGERLPGAFQSAARAIGVTTQELDKMLQAGKLTAEDLLPKLAQELDKTFGTTERIETFSASWQRFMNTLQFSSQQVGESTGAMDLLSGALDKASAGIQFITLAVTAMAAQFEAAGKSIGAFFAYISSDTSWAQFKSNVSEAFDEANARIDEARERIQKFRGEFEDAGDTISETGQAADSAAAGMDNLAGSTEDAAIAAQQAEFAWVSLNAVLDESQAQNARLAASYLTQIQNAKSAEDVTRALKSAVDELADNQQALALVSEASAKRIVELGQGTKEAAEAMSELGEAQKKSAAQTEKTGERVKVFNEVLSEAMTITEKMARHLQFWQKEMDGLSEAARRNFDVMVETINQLGGRFPTGMAAATNAVQDHSAEIQELNRHYLQMRDVARTATSDVTRWMAAIEAAAVLTKQAFLEQEDAAARIEARLKNTAALTEEQAEATRRAIASFNLLDQTRLDNLQSQVDSIRRATEALEESAARTLRTLQDELDRMRGNVVDIELRRFQAQQLELQEQLNAARKAGDAEAIASLEKALLLSKQIHEIKLAELKTERDIISLEDRRNRKIKTDDERRASSGADRPITIKVDTPIYVDGKVMARAITPHLTEFGKLSQ